MYQNTKSENATKLSCSITFKFPKENIICLTENKINVNNYLYKSQSTKRKNLCMRKTGASSILYRIVSLEHL